jgi:hypothetical protein
MQHSSHGQPSVLEADTLSYSSGKRKSQWTVWKNVQWNKLAAKHK